MAFRYLVVNNGIHHAKLESSAYDESTILGSPVSSGTPITLPNSGTYNGDELEVYLNNIRQEDVLDYNWVGSAPRTQVSFTKDLITGDVLRFRKDLV